MSGGITLIKVLAASSLLIVGAALAGEEAHKQDCVTCHGRAGEGDAESLYPRVAGQHYEYLLRQIRNIHGGKRRNADPDMVKATDGYRDADMQAVTDYISYLPLVASPGS